MGILRGLGGVGVYRVRGRSMEPRFFDGELLLVWGVGVKGGLRRGDVVVFRHPSVEGRLMLKRVAGAAGGAGWGGWGPGDCGGCGDVGGG